MPPLDSREPSGRSRGTGRRAVLAVLIALLVGLLGVVAAGATPVGTDTTVGEGPTAAANETGGTDTAVDVVFVFDNSLSTNEDRYHMAQEIDRLARIFAETGVDANYALVTYNDTVRVEQPLTAEFDAFERAMHFEAGGSTENASDALLAAGDIETRESASTVVVLVTDEDDDSTNASRDRALASLAGTEFVAVSPESPATSNCANHSPPCDNRTDNELRTMADGVEGTWIGMNASAATTVDRIGAAIDEEFSPNATADRPRSATFEVTDAAANRTTVDVGDRVAVTATIENVGQRTGEYEAYLSHRGRILAETTVRVPATDTRTVTLTHAFAAPGTYDLLVTHHPAATIAVLEGPDTTTTSTATATNASGATGARTLVDIVPLVIGLLAVGLVVVVSRHL